MSRCPHACAAVAPADVEQAIAREHYFTALAGTSAGSDSTFHACPPAPNALRSALGLLTFCVLGRQDALLKMWPLLGYDLQTRMTPKDTVT